MKGQRQKVGSQVLSQMFLWTSFVLVLLLGLLLIVDFEGSVGQGSGHVAWTAGLPFRVAYMGRGVQRVVEDKMLPQQWRRGVLSWRNKLNLLLHVQALPAIQKGLHLVREGWDLVKPGGALHPAEFIQHKGHLVLEGIILVIIIYFMAQRSSKPVGKRAWDRPLTEREIQELCDEWEPEPLHGTREPTTFQKAWLNAVPLISSRAGRKITVNGREGVLDFVTTNFLGLAEEASIEKAAEATIEKYGVGSCGPRGFYGTIDVHLHLEERIAAFLESEESILYSYDVATVPSIIPAFANAKDVIVMDDGCCGTMRSGCNLSRAKIVTFRHNDTQDLERKIEAIVKEDRKLKKPLNRRFVVIEGVYQNTGELAPIKEIVRIKNKYKFRLLVDESMSIAVLGHTGRGAVEHAGVPLSDVEIIAGSLGNAVASIGGFCAGSREIVDHQRLSGLGYCFSASLPPYLASTGMAALDMIQSETGHIRMAKVRENALKFRKLMEEKKGFYVVGGTSIPSPLIHIKLAPVNLDPSTWDTEELILQEMVNFCLEKHKIFFSVAKYSKLDSAYRPSPSIKLTVSAMHSTEDLEAASAALEDARKVIVAT